MEKWTKEMSKQLEEKEIHKANKHEMMLMLRNMQIKAITRNRTIFLSIRLTNI